MSSDRSFAWIFAAVFCFIGIMPAFQSHAIHWWAVAIAVLLMLIAIIAPHVLHPFNVLWFHFGRLLHRIITPFILAVVYFMVITPIAIILRIMRKDVLCRKLDPVAKSYWIYREPSGPKPDSIRKQF